MSDGGGNKSKNIAAILNFKTKKIILQNFYDNFLRGTYSMSQITILRDNIIQNLFLDF